MEKSKGISYNFSSNENCIFSSPLENIQRAKFLSIMMNYQDEFSIVLQTGNNREMAITAACLLENQIDEINNHWIPGYKTLVNDHDTTFSYKIKLCKALRLIPSKLLEAVNIFREIRNDFAHNLKTGTFDDLENNTKYHEKIKTVIRKFSKEHEFKSLKEDFSLILSIVHLGLNTYIEHVKYLGIVLRNSNIFEQIAKSINPSPDQIAGVQKNGKLEKFDTPVNFIKRDNEV